MSQFCIRLPRLIVMVSWQPSRVESWSWPSSRDASHATKDEWAQWKCGHCSTPNWQHYGSQAKRCRHCGIKKSYKDAALQPSDNVPASNNNYNNYRNSVSAKLAEVASHLKAAVAPPPAYSELDRGSGAANRKASSEEITSLETALASIPNNEEYAATRASLEAKIAEKKESIWRARPIGKQVDECQQLVARCRARREQADQGAALAQIALAEAEEQLCNAENRLRVLQAEIARSEPPQQGLGSMENLTASLGKVISEMKCGGHVSEDVIGQAEAQMLQLLSGLQLISAEALAKAAATSGRGATAPDESMTDGAKRPGDEESGPATRRRMMTKTEASPDFVPPDLRPRSNAEADLMQAFPPVHKSPHGS